MSEIDFIQEELKAMYKAMYKLDQQEEYEKIEKLFQTTVEKITSEYNAFSCCEDKWCLCVYDEFADTFYYIQLDDYNFRVTEISFEAFAEDYIYLLYSNSLYNTIRDLLEFIGAEGYAILESSDEANLWFVIKINKKRPRIYEFFRGDNIFVRERSLDEVCEEISFYPLDSFYSHHLGDWIRDCREFKKK